MSQKIPLFVKCDLLHTKGCLHLNLRILRIEERLLHHRSPVSYAKHWHLYLRSRDSVFHRQIAVDNALAHGITITGAGYMSQNTLTIEHWLSAKGNCPRIIDDQAAQLARYSRSFDTL